MKREDWYNTIGNGYFIEQATQPQTLGILSLRTFGSVTDAGVNRLLAGGFPGWPPCLDIREAGPLDRQLSLGR